MKLVILLTFLCGYAYAQSGLETMAYMSMMGNGGAAGANAGGSNILMRMLNNPFRLCRETDNMRAIPCARNNICNTMSIMQYGLPNLMKCSPMGVGCCLKDAMSLHLVKRMN